MRRGGCARRAMLGAVAAGALLGAARGYEIDLIAGDTGPDDDEYKVVTTAGLEIVIGPKDGNEYDIASAVPSPNDNNLAVGIAVVGGKNDDVDALAIIPSSCPGGITLDASTGNIVCYDVARGPQDTSVVVTNGVIAVAGGEFTPGTTNENYDFDTDCVGDIDVKITGEIVCYSTDDGSLKDADVIVTNTDTDPTSRTFTVSGTIETVDNSDFDVDTNCPGGITILRGSAVSGNIVCYDVERGDALVTNSLDDNGDSGSIVVTETKSDEKTTIAGASATITVDGGADLETEGTNYKIELNTGNGAVTETPLDGPPVGPDTTRTETVTVRNASGVPQSRTTTVTAPDVNDAENVEDITVTVTEETANSATPYFPGTVTAKDETQ